MDGALGSFEVPFFNKVLLALGRPFVHRVQMITGKDPNALDEVELLCDFLMDKTGSSAPAT